MPLHFTKDEFARRTHAVQATMVERGLSALLLFAPESHYYLTGYDTFGFAMFQCLVLPVDGPAHLLTRAPDLRQAQQTSTVSNDRIHIWADQHGVAPIDDLIDLLSQLNLLGQSVGVETNTVGLKASDGFALFDKLQHQIQWSDASGLVAVHRRVKSAREIDYHRRAAELSDLALDDALALTTAGAFEGDILAAMQGRVFKGGGDYAGNEFIIGSGEAALLCRYQSGRRNLDSQDQLTLEWSGAYRRYHAAMMRTLVVGSANPVQQRMHAAAVEALVACEEAIVPGRAMGDVFEAHARVFDQHGLQYARMNACGYGMGAIYNPIWVDFPMFYQGNPVLMQTGNVFFLHMILMDSDAGLAMCWGHSVLVTDNGVERLSRHSLDLPVLV